MERFKNGLYRQAVTHSDLRARHQRSAGRSGRLQNSCSTGDRRESPGLAVRISLPARQSTITPSHFPPPRKAPATRIAQGPNSQRPGAGPEARPILAVVHDQRARAIAVATDFCKPACFGCRAKNDGPLAPRERIAHPVEFFGRVVRFSLVAARLMATSIPSSAVRQFAHCNVLASLFHADTGSGKSIVGGGASPGRLVQGASGGIQVPW